jgi:hypothetical protein
MDSGEPLVGRRGDRGMKRAVAVAPFDGKRGLTRRLK